MICPKCNRENKKYADLCIWCDIPHSNGFALSDRFKYADDPDVRHTESKLAHILWAEDHDPIWKQNKLEQKIWTTRIKAEIANLREQGKWRHR